MKEGYTMNLTNTHYKILKFISAHEGISYTDFLNDCPVSNLEYHVKQLTKSGYLDCPHFGPCFSSISMGKISNRMNTRTIDYRLPDTISITVKGKVALEEYEESKFFKRLLRFNLSLSEWKSLISILVIILPVLYAAVHLLTKLIPSALELAKQLLFLLGL